MTYSVVQSWPVSDESTSISHGSNAGFSIETHPRHESRERSVSDKSKRKSRSSALGTLGNRWKQSRFEGSGGEKNCQMFSDSSHPGSS